MRPRLPFLPPRFSVSSLISHVPRRGPPSGASTMGVICHGGPTHYYTTPRVLNRLDPWTRAQHTLLKPQFLVHVSIPPSLSAFSPPFDPSMLGAVSLPGRFP
jgi:hypothetical protein